MSATRDSSQKFTFVYSNLYHLYQKGKVAAKDAKVPAPNAHSTPIAVPTTRASLRSEDTAGIDKGRVLKTEDLRDPAFRVTSHEPPRLLGKRLEVARQTPSDTYRVEAMDGLRDNLKTLQGLHERLRFMLKELEDLVNTKKD